MTEFTLALTLFLAAHSVPAAPRIRDRMVSAMGLRLYLFTYSLLSIALLAWLVVATRRADTVLLWHPAAWQWYVALVLMPFALFFGVSGLLTPNPLSISLRGGEEPGPAVAVTRHPLLWGFLLWAAAHIPANGDLATVVLFGSMSAFAGLGFHLLDAKARGRLGQERWRELSRTYSNIPFAALLAGRVRISTWKLLVFAATASLALYAWILLQGHALLVGSDPLASLWALG